MRFKPFSKWSFTSVNFQESNVSLVPAFNIWSVKKCAIPVRLFTNFKFFRCWQVHSDFKKLKIPHYASAATLSYLCSVHNIACQCSRLQLYCPASLKPPRFNWSLDVLRFYTITSPNPWNIISTFIQTMNNTFKGFILYVSLGVEKQGEDFWFL